MGDGKVAFIAIPAPSGAVVVSRSVTVIAEDDYPCKVPIMTLVTAKSCFNAESASASGYIRFETV